MYSMTFPVVVCLLAVSSMVDSLFLPSATIALGSAAATAGTTTLFITPAGAALGAAALVGAAVVKAAVVGSALSRNRRDVDTADEHVRIFQRVDNYFQLISDVDVDDCGKRYVCEIEALDENQRTPEEQLITTLFGDSPLDPTSAKAEYDLAAFLGTNSRSNVACATRYNRCQFDRITISQAIQKSQA